jgi:hypothetical protein
LEVGDAFVNVDPGSPSHLWVVIAKSSDDVAIVNFTSKTSLSADESCVITKGEHSFVAHDTIVLYRAAKMPKGAVLDSARDHKYLEMYDRVSPALLLRIQQGALTSPFCPMKIQAAVRKMLGR